MATRQYIGARYVIKIYENSQNAGSAEWEANTNFEPLTMVTYQNGSYLSKKQVPPTVGNPAANTDYWVQTGFYNGQIASLQAQIDDINNNKLPAITAAIEALEDKSYNIGSANELSSKNIIIITDSYGNVADGDGNYFDHYFKNALGLNDNQVQFNALSARGFTTTSQSAPSTFLDMLQAMTISDADAISDIIVVGGANDVLASSQTVIESAIQTFVAYCKLTFKNARVLIACAGRHNHDAGNTDAIDNKVLPAYINCGKYGATPIVNFNLVLHNDTLQASDGIHPNTLGVAELGTKLAEGYLNGIVDVKYAVSSTPSQDGTWKSNFTWIEKLANGVCTCGVGTQGQIVLTTNNVDSPLANISIGTVDSIAVGYSPYLLGVTVRIMAQTSGDLVQHYGYGILFKYANTLGLSVSTMDTPSDVSLTNYINLVAFPLNNFIVAANEC